MNKRWEIFLFLLISAILVFAFSWPLIWSATENARMVDAFDVDEALHVHIVQEALQNKSFHLMFNNYGHLYFNLALIPLFVMDSISPVTEQQMIVVLRIIPVLFALGTMLLIFILGRRYFGRFVAWSASLLLTIVPLTFQELSVLSHPDLPQVFFLMAGLYFACRLWEERFWYWLVLGSAMAGMAFACKYSGIFILPILWLIELLGVFQNRTTRENTEETGQFKSRLVLFTTSIVGFACLLIAVVASPAFIAQYLTGDGQIDGGSKLIILHVIRIAAAVIGAGLLSFTVIRLFPLRDPKWTTWMNRLHGLVFRLLISMAAFTLAFWIGSPYLFLGLSFISGILYESQHTSVGHTFIEMPSPIDWFKMLTSGILLGPLLSISALFHLSMIIYQGIKKKFTLLKRPEAVLWFWILFYMAYMILRVAMIRDRYLLPVLPILVILAMIPVSKLLNECWSRLKRIQSLGIMGIVIILFFVLEGIPSIQDSVAFHHRITDRGQSNPVVEAGIWLEAEFPHETRILYDRFSYIPSKFQNVEGSFLATPDMIVEFDPDLVVTSKNGRWPFQDINDAPNYVKGEALFHQRYSYYKNLDDGSAGYDLIRDFGDIQVFIRKSKLSKNQS